MSAVWAQLSGSGWLSLTLVIAGGEFRFLRSNARWLHAWACISLRYATTYVHVVCVVSASLTKFYIPILLQPHA